MTDTLIQTGIKTKEFDYAVSATRIISTLFILLCHYFSVNGYSSIGQLFNVGVFVFFLISGYLYGKKPMKAGKWLFGRFIRICVPMYIVMILITAYYVIKEQNAELLVRLPKYILNLQGLDKIFVFLSGKGILMGYFVGSEHLWFLTVLMLCYIFTVAYKKVEPKTCISKVQRICILAVLSVTSVALGMVKIVFAYFLIYFFGYHLSRMSDKITFGKMCIYGLAAVAAIGIRFLGRRYFDALSLYDNAIVPLSHCVLACFIFMFIRFMFKWKERYFKKIASSAFVKHLDSVSFYIYLTHYFFLFDPFGLKLPKPVDIVLSLVITVVSAELLKLACDMIIRRIFSKKNPAA